MKDYMNQLDQETRKVDFDSFDISVKELISMANESIINIAPEYQRQFRWPEENQSKLVESVLLGIPIPNLFMAANRDGSWELIDGVQRLNSLIHFCGTPEQIESFGLDKPLRLKGLDILSEFNGATFDDLPHSLRLKFSLRPLKVTTLSDKSDLKVRFDLFERLNTGGIKLTPQEIRACVFRGQFNDFIVELAKNDDFNKVVNVSSTKAKDGTKEELVLKFLAYKTKRDGFKHSVETFLNDFMAESSVHFNYKKYRELFEKTFESLRTVLPEGIKRGNKGSTPQVLFEAISIGAADAIEAGVDITGSDVANWIDDEELRRLTTGATNSGPRLRERIEYCRVRFVDNV
ncbi:DUF262 domain-containing protein [Vibrio parahaemolyticus]|uniref:DUF262 domain-containing protein n=1 Tax=Vibrio TaxID=662 RepID=UPI0005016F58|nr:MULTISPECIES: DUF262 domain-containing protein [Vibrio]EKO3791020.1 DUF262 domain-containing protein [Vibrio metschnikovii]EGR0119059.1 DUF262 domain-containing protein [Vibrio parahaemolyticus]EGR0246000.1 DUF262 domain-containing protein [Vibrio parahaemolyticus]EIE1224507.1 DUF262 domain-containing protein [Vibrio vulnificus]EIN4363505.1 DUF262 domain-containing protein [Vibrio parahaemolyticus]